LFFVLSSNFWQAFRKDFITSENLAQELYNYKLKIEEWKDRKRCHVWHIPLESFNWSSKLTINSSVLFFYLWLCATPVVTFAAHTRA